MDQRSTLAGQREQYRNALDDALQAIVDKLRSMPEVERAILFGSYAEGRRDLFTDLDLLVVMRSDQSFVERTAALYQRIQVAVDLDLLPYTPEEIERLADHGIVAEALRTGRVVYEKVRA